MLSYVASAAACARRGGIAVAFHPGPQTTCVRPSGRVRRVGAAAQCGRREQRLRLPRNARTYFCVELSNGAMLRRVGGPAQCASSRRGANGVVRQRLVYVVNHAPTGLSLAGAGVAENQPAGAPVGRLAATDPDAGARLTYSLVGGDSAAFRISGDALATAVPFDFEGRSGYAVTVRATDEWGLSVQRTFAVAVTDVNEAPVDVSLSPASVTENQPPGTTVGALSATDPDRGESLTWSLVPGTSDNDYFRVVGSTLVTNRVLDFEDKPGFGVHVRATDRGGLGFQRVLTVQVTDVVETPAPVPELSVADLSLVEGNLGVSTAMFTVSLSPASAQVVTVGFATADGTATVAGSDYGAATGTLTFNPGETSKTVAVLINGDTVIEPDESFTVSLASAVGAPVSDGQATGTITNDDINDPPRFVKGADQTVLEDAGAQNVNGWATAISSGPPDEAGQTVSFTVTANTNAALFSAGPAVAADGTLTYAPAEDANGQATITLKAVDSDGAESATQSFVIRVTAVNDAPSFDTLAGNPPTVNEDVTSQTVANFATGISAGPANESGQALSFVVTNNSNAALFVPVSGLPTISPTGTLSYTLAANESGTATITVRLTDDGGIANGGVDTSPTQQFTITVNAVNDAPSFVGGGGVSVNEDSGPYGAAWASGISAGPADESAQTLAFQVSNDNNALFSAQPAVSAVGTVTFTPDANGNGSATVSVFLTDNGGTANGGDDTSDTQTFTITVNAVNDEPRFTLPASPNQSVLQDSGLQTVSAFATSISAGAADESAQTLTFNVSNTNNALFSAQPDIDEATGTLTYTPAAGQTGTATVSVFLTDDGGTANGGNDTSPTETFTITVAPPNVAPVALGQTGGSAVAATEDGGAVTITLTATDSDDDDLTFSIVVSPTKGSLGPIGIHNCTTTPNTCTATVSYTPAANQNGADSFTFKANDGQADSNTATVEVTIAPVNDLPSFTKGADQTVLEDAGAQTVNGWATAISPGPADESGQSVSFTITGNTNAALLSAGPVVASNGTLTYTPAANAFGTAAITLKAIDNGTPPAESATQTFNIAVTGVNDAPSFTKGADQTVLEDAGAQTVSGWATAISAGPNESAQAVTFEVTGNTNAALFSAGPAVASNGTLTYAPAVNAFGTAAITLKAVDDGGTANGGVNESATQTFNITLTPVNDAPSFTKGADQTVLEDAGAQTVNGWATAISAGPNESAQTVSFEITNNTNAALFAAGPAVSPAGNLTYTPAANANGSATITLRITDDGGTANGGVNASNTQTFIINVTAVNDAPSFTKGADQTVAEDAAAQTVSGWATAISAGPANESAQTVSFEVTGNTNAGLFSAGPSVSPTGALTYTPAANQNGTATITLRVTDNGGTSNGGVNVSATQTFVVTVTAVNDAPVAQAKSYTAQTNMKITGLGGLLTGVADADSGVNGCTPSFSVASVGPTTPAGGTISNVNAAAGTFDFDPPPGVTGNVTFSYTVSDTGCPGTATSAPATITVNVSGPVIWFADDSAAAGGDGRLSSPFNTLVAVVNVDAANHRVFLYSGTYTTGIALNTGEWLVGQGVTGFASFDTLMGITPPAGTITRPTIGTGTATVQGTATLNSSAFVRALALSTGASAGLNDPAGAITSVDVAQTSVATTTGTAVALSDIGGTITLTGLTTTGAAGATLTGANSAATFTFAGVTVSSGANPGISSTGAGTLTITGATNTLTSTTGTALNVTNTTIGASGLTFRSISAGTAADSPANGIVLNGTGSAGGLTVTGNGGTCTPGTPTCTGGTIQNTTGADNSGATPSGTGIVLNNTQQVSLTNMRIRQNGNYGIRGDDLTGFSFANGLIDGVNGTNVSSPFNDGSINLDRVVGAISITGSDISGGFQRNIKIDHPATDASATATITITGNSIHDTSSSFGDDGIGIEAENSDNYTVNVSNNTFARHGGDHVNVTMINSAVIDVTISNNTLSGGHPVGLGQGILVFGANWNGTGTYDVTNNTINGNRQGGAIHMNKGSGTATMSGTISGNVIGTAGVVGSGSAEAFGIIVGSRGAGGSHTVLITSNTIRQYFDRGIVAQAGEGNASLNITVTNNIVTEFADAINSLHGIHLDVGILSTDAGSVCADIGGAGTARNNVTTAGNEPAGGVDIRVRRGSAMNLQLRGYAGGSEDDAAVNAYLLGRNDATTVSATSPGTGTTSNTPAGAACATP